MPLRRYQIRNECSLADPELYRAADKNDPEALLEGFAMAGLVGVLRQLGDLSEFAAEVFHDLHEEVMATSARGHNLKLRVQQLEADFPSIEKAFLSQTNHSSFFYNAGTDWHPYMPVDQHLISRGNMPRFIMDSYEECRGPPNLFLLDKFDIAGAGACLKRYTDPSFYRAKASNPGITNADVQCEKRTRNGKKKGSYWCKGEPQKVLPTSHFKLHRLLLEERIESTVSGPARSVNLKRRLNGFPFDSKTGESYMEKFTEISSEHKVVVERSFCSSPLKLPPKSTYESGLDRHAISLESPNEELRHRRVSPTPDLEGTMQNLSMDGDGISESPKVNCGFEADNSLSTIRGEVCEKGITIDEGCKMESNVRGCQSDDVASEVDNYVDARTATESEMVTDSELRAKSDLQVLNNKRQMSGLCASEAQQQSHSSDSVRSSMSSDEGNSSFKKGISNSSFSDTPSISADNTPLDDEVSCERFHSTEISKAIGTYRSPNQLHANGDIRLAPSADDFLSKNLHVSGLPDNMLRLDPAATSTDDQIESPVPVTSHVAEQSLDLMWEELETRSNGAGLDDGVRDVDVMISPSWVVAGDIEPIMESPNSHNLKELKAPVIICDIPKLDSAEDGTSCNGEENFHDFPSSPNEENNIEVDIPGKFFVEMDATDLLLSPDVDSLTSNVHLTEADVKRDESDSAPLAGLEENGNQGSSLYLDLKKLDEESLLSFGESNKNRMEGEVSVPDSYSESSVVMEVGISQFASPDLSSDMYEPVHYDHTESEVLDNVPNSYSQVESSLDLDNTAETSPILEQSGLDTNRLTSQESNFSHHTDDASSLPIHRDTEEQKSVLSLDQLDEVETKVLQNEPEANIESSPKDEKLNTDSVYASVQPHEEISQYQHQIALETSLKDETLDKGSVHSEENLIIANALPTMIENERVQNVIPSPEREITLPAQEDAKVNEVRITKLPRPRNPLIDDVVGIEKIKLRKVTDRPRPPVQKVDERDSILEQIRAKSYNLKPTVVTRPIVQGPTTNLQVAALVEKAQAIQQTRAGSDEDDEDTWSD